MNNYKGKLISQMVAKGQTRYMSERQKKSKKRQRSRKQRGKAKQLKTQAHRLQLMQGRVNKEVHLHLLDQQVLNRF